MTLTLAPPPMICKVTGEDPQRPDHKNPLIKIELKDGEFVIHAKERQHVEATGTHPDHKGRKVTFSGKNCVIRFKNPNVFDPPTAILHLCERELKIKDGFKGETAYCVDKEATAHGPCDFAADPHLVIP